MEKHGLGLRRGKSYLALVGGRCGGNIFLADIHPYFRHIRTLNVPSTPLTVTVLLYLFLGIVLYTSSPIRIVLGGNFPPPPIAAHNTPSVPSSMELPSIFSRRPVIVAAHNMGQHGGCRSPSVPSSSQWWDRFRQGIGKRDDVTCRPG